MIYSLDMQFSMGILKMLSGDLYLLKSSDPSMFLALKSTANLKTIGMSNRYQRLKKYKSKTIPLLPPLPSQKLNYSIPL
jgi:hypothetical protein